MKGKTNNCLLAHSVSIKIYSGIVQFPCDSTAFLQICGNIPTQILVCVTTPFKFRHQHINTSTAFCGRLIGCLVGKISVRVSWL